MRNRIFKLILSEVLVLVFFLSVEGYSLEQKPVEGAEKQDGKPTVGNSVNSAGQELEKGIKKIFSEFDNKPLAEVIYADDKDDKGLAEKCEYEQGKGCKVYPVKKGGIIGFALVWQGKGFKGPIKLLLGLSPEGDIAGMDVLSHQDTPKLGGKIETAEFQGQFIKRNLKNTRWMLEKDGGDIRAVSGASYSSRGVVEIVKGALEFFEKNKEQLKKQVSGR